MSRNRSNQIIQRYFESGQSKLSKVKESPSSHDTRVSRVYGSRISRSSKISSNKASVRSIMGIGGSIARKGKKLFKNRNEVKIVLGTQDVTPNQMPPLRSYMMRKEQRNRSISQLDISRFSNTNKSASEAIEPAFSTVALSSVALHTQIQSLHSSVTTSSSIIKHDRMDIYSHSEDETFSWAKESQKELSISEAAEKITTMMPSKISIVLRETPTFYIYEMPSVTELKGSEEGDKVEKANEDYDYLTIGKGRNRKTTNAEIQTNEVVLKTKGTQGESFKKRNSYSFASCWDMLDTYNGVSEIVQGKTVAVKKNYTKEELDKQMINLIHNPNFQDSVIVIERILANNTYIEQQKRFRGLVEQDPFRPDVEFKYNLDLLWTFKNEKTEGHPVTSMHWNPKNHDILAVGYGKFFYNENKNGFVYCWNIKNPRQPEREIYFKRPVMSVAFSETTPNLLAVGLYDGKVQLLDITKRDVVIVAVTAPQFSATRVPIWQVDWLPPDEYDPKSEPIVCVGEDGRICKLTRGKNYEFISAPFMKTLKIEGKLKGVYHPRHCPVTDVPLTKCAAALLITKNPTDKNKYLVGTDEGTLHRCSKQFINQHIDMFVAHNGPIYACQYSHFCSNFFLTCGADCCINIWTENILRPLITLTKNMEAVEGACWNPANSTIIASIVGSEIIIWDLQRRTYLPTAVHKNPYNHRNTQIQFTESGRNLVVADIEGNVHIYTLEDMPFPPFYQGQMLKQVIKKTLVTKQEIWEQINTIC